MENIGGVALMSLLIPFLATTLLAVEALAQGERDGPVRAYLATAVSYLVCLSLEVAFFAATFVAYLPERYLITMLPPLFLGLCLWLARGASRPIWILLGVVCASVVAVGTISPDDLFAAVGTHDLLTTLSFRGLVDGIGDGTTRAAVIGVTVVASAAFVLVPARRARMLVIALATGLALISIGASREIARESRLEEAKAFGEAEPEWIDAAAKGEKVALLNTGDREWPIIPRTVFWNRRVTTVARLPARTGSGAMPQVRVDPGMDGILRTEDGGTLEEPLVAAPAGVTLDGTPVAVGAPTSAASNLVLWRVIAPARLESVVSGLGANGDFAGSVYVTVYACGPGRLELTLIGKSGGPLRSAPTGSRSGRLWRPRAASGRVPSPHPRRVEEPRSASSSSLRRGWWARPGSPSNTKPDLERCRSWRPSGGELVGAASSDLDRALER